MAYSFYNVNNPPNFKVRDPIARLTNEVAGINYTLDGIHPNGRTFFFDGEALQTWRADELVSFLPSYTGTLLMSHYAPAQQQTKTITVPTKDFAYVIFGTNPTQDLLGPNCTEATWHVHLYNQTTSTQLSVGMLPLFGALVNSTWSIDYMWDYFYPVRIAPQTSDLVTETTIKNLVSATQSRVKSSQLWCILAFYNENTVDENITLYFGGPRELNTRTRLETNWLTDPQPPLMSWVNGYYASGSTDFSPFDTNPLQGAFSSIYTTGPVQMSQLYGTSIDVSLRPWNNANIWGYFYNGDYSYIKISDVYNPENALLGYLDGYDLNQSTPNPYTVYKGFNYIYKTNWGDDPCINRLVIFSLTGGNNAGIVEGVRSYYDNDTNEDYWTFETYGTYNPDTLIYTSVYGTGTTIAFTPQEIHRYFQAFVDYVIYNGSATVADVDVMQYNFNTNFNILKAMLPPLIPNFQFLTFENCNIFGGLGSNFRPNIGVGRGYIVPDGYEISPISNAGFGYIVGEIVTVSGTDLGGLSPANDAIITITSVDGGGAVLTYSVTGTTKYLQNQTNIYDGGNDQYDTGNYIATNWTNPVSYGEGNIQNGVFGPDSTTVIDYNDSIFVCFNRNTYNNPYFEIYGNLGFNGNGNYEVGNINQSMNMFILDNYNYGSNGNLIPGNIYSIELSNANANYSLAATGTLSLKKKCALRGGKSGPIVYPTKNIQSAKSLRKQAFFTKPAATSEKQTVAKRNLRRQNPNVVQRLEDQLVTLSVDESQAESLNKVNPATFIQTLKSKFAIPKN